MDIKYYTLKEAAELLGMTKPGIRYHLKALGETIEKNEKGQIIVSESILQRIRDNTKPESEVESKPESNRKVESYFLKANRKVMQNFPKNRKVNRKVGRKVCGK